ncbi:hypothetical protein [Helicobacter felistomachi]|uniref:hypothetical protein n=1 Tax=Helicobacter felistomachi TaxID=3040201 RepID=UPI0025739C96|nr:hypothetical protein [Helicobacter sp. NHP21005]
METLNDALMPHLRLNGADEERLLVWLLEQNPPQSLFFQQNFKRPRGRLKMLITKTPSPPR